MKTSVEVLVVHFSKYYATFECCILTPRDKEGLFYYYYYFRECIGYL